MDNKSAITRIKFLLDVGGSDGFNYLEKEALETAIKALEGKPVRQGLWLDKFHYEAFGEVMAEYRCSHCGFAINEARRKAKPNYCSNCGTKMGAEG